ncbi:hypothetical protein A5746_00890 [Mycolicibacterium conceptionense]|nr:hypothetical protein A5639_11850 [Mycolicibacterium conceptionense]OMB98730.1 hypothetical protein A5746_00890 [Mycolicibacterium conceptionense]
MIPDEDTCPDCGCLIPIYYRRVSDQERVAVFAYHTTVGELSATRYDEICPKGGTDYPKPT